MGGRGRGRGEEEGGGMRTISCRRWFRNWALGGFGNLQGWTRQEGHPQVQRTGLRGCLLDCMSACVWVSALS